MPQNRKTFQICFIPQRYIIASLLFFGAFSSYLIRVSFEPGMDYIQIPQNESDLAITTSFCNFTESGSGISTVNAEHYTFTKEEVHKIRDCFFWGYLIGHMPGGIIADKFGGKYVLGASVLSISALHLLVPIVLKLGTWNRALSLYAIRSLIGCGCGAVFPAIHALLSNWCPTKDRGKLSGIVFSSTQFAVTLNLAVTGNLIQATQSWSSLFYISGGFAALWTIIWFFVGFSNYAKSPLVPEKEFSYLSVEIGASLTEFKAKKIPWFDMLKSLPLWVLIIANIGHNWVWHIVMKSIPVYMRQIFGFTIIKCHELTSITYTFTGILTIILSVLSDFLINHGYIYINTARKILTIFGAMGPTIYLLAGSFVGCLTWLAILLFTVGISFTSCYYAGTRINTLELAPNFSGTIMGLCNGFGAVTGLFVPELVEFLTQNKTLSEWQYVFVMFVGIRILTTLPFVVFGTAEEQAWNRPKSEEEKRMRRRETLIDDSVVSLSDI